MVDEARAGAFAVLREYDDSCAELDRVEEVLDAWEKELDRREAEFRLLELECESIAENQGKTGKSLDDLKKDMARWNRELADLQRRRGGG
jgi:chromosome segregation ATPase